MIIELIIRKDLDAVLLQIGCQTRGYTGWLGKEQEPVAAEQRKGEEHGVALYVISPQVQKPGDIIQSA